MSLIYECVRRKCTAIKVQFLAPFHPQQYRNLRQTDPCSSAGTEEEEEANRYTAQDKPSFSGGGGEGNG